MSAEYICYGTARSDDVGHTRIENKVGGMEFGGQHTENEGQEDGGDQQ